MTTRPRADRDSGSALILCLVLILIGGLFVIPLLSYAVGVLKTNAIVETRTTRGEAVEGALRVAMYDSTKLYAACQTSGPTQATALATPPPAPGLPAIQTVCNTIDTGSTNAPGEQRYAITTTQVGSEAFIPAPDPDVPSQPELNGTISSTWCTSRAGTPPVPCGKPYPNNGNAVTTTWQADTSTASEASKVFLPLLPAPDQDVQPATGFTMPSWNPEGPCKVYFPGTYKDDVTLTGATPYYFVSGVYYFEKTVRITGGATVVVGTGVEPGCVDSDSTAVLNAEVSPGVYPNRRQVDGASGVGGTFVFGANGRLVIDDAVAGTIKFNMNRRMEAATSPEAVLNDISILSVNGVTGTTTTTALDLPGQMNVPPSRVLGGTPEPVSHLYAASTLVSPATASTSCRPPAALVAGCPIIDMSFNTTANVKVRIPGYVAVPQGAFNLSTLAAATANKNLSFGGGILAAQMQVTGGVPQSLQLGVVESVVQRKFKIVSRTITGAPTVTATAIVQVNETGGFAINSYTVEAN